MQNWNILDNDTKEMEKEKRRSYHQYTEQRLNELNEILEKLDNNQNDI